MRYMTINKAIAINQRMVIIPAEDYELLLREAGFAPTAHLDRTIAAARKRFKQSKTVSWKSVKNGFKKVQH